MYNHIWKVIQKTHLLIRQICANHTIKNKANYNTTIFLRMKTTKDNNLDTEQFDGRNLSWDNTLWSCRLHYGFRR